MKEHPPRTPIQNDDMHLYFDQLAEALRDCGYGVKETLRHDIDIPWTGELVKILMWKKIQLAMFGKKSTTKLDTAEVSQVYEVINKHLAETVHVSIPFPSKEELMWKSRQKK